MPHPFPTDLLQQLESSAQALERTLNQLRHFGRLPGEKITQSRLDLKNHEGVLANYTARLTNAYENMARTQANLEAELETQHLVASETFQDKLSPLAARYDEMSSTFCFLLNELKADIIQLQQSKQASLSAPHPLLTLALNTDSFKLNTNRAQEATLESLSSLSGILRGLNDQTITPLILRVEELRYGVRQLISDSAPIIRELTFLAEQADKSSRHIVSSRTRIAELSAEFKENMKALEHLIASMPGKIAERESQQAAAEQAQRQQQQAEREQKEAVEAQRRAVQQQQKEQREATERERKAQARQRKEAEQQRLAAQERQPAETSLARLVADASPLIASATESAAAATKPRELTATERERLDRDNDAMFGL